MISLEKIRDNSVVARNFNRLARSVIDTGGRALGLRIGAATLTYAAANITPAATVNHNLGRTPAIVLSMGTTGLGKLHTVNYVAGSRNATTFQLQAQTNDLGVVTGSISVFWVALG